MAKRFAHVTGSDRMFRQDRTEDTQVLSFLRLVHGAARSRQCQDPDLSGLPRQPSSPRRLRRGGGGCSGSLSCRKSREAESAGLVTESGNAEVVGRSASKFLLSIRKEKMAPS